VVGGKQWFLLGGVFLGVGCGGLGCPPYFWVVFCDEVFGGGCWVFVFCPRVKGKPLVTKGGGANSVPKKEELEGVVRLKIGHWKEGKDQVSRPRR